MAYSIPVIEGAQMIRSGASVEEVITHINEWLEHTRPMFVPLDLKCVKKSGRISPAVAFVGDVLGLKPLITFEDGEAKIVSKTRGEKNAIKMLLDRCMSERRPGTNYALVPDYHFPVPLIQMNQSIRFIDEHKDEYHINMDNVILMGSSAGAIMTARFSSVTMRKF